jgi:hypothetical protein
MKSKHKESGSKGGEITLRFDGGLVSPEVFRKAVNAFVDLLIQVSAEIAEGDDKPAWNMSVRTGSNVLVARPLPEVNTRKKANEAIKVVISGFRKMEHGTSDIPHFNRKALQAAKDLGTILAKPGKEGITLIELRAGNGKAISITARTSEIVASKIGVQHQAYGSIEGRLQTITERGTFQFVVYEALSDRGINCFIPQEKFKEAHAAFGKRVSISGVVQYDRAGMPVSIKVETIRIFREIDELPPIEQFRGVLKQA